MSRGSHEQDRMNVNIRELLERHLSGETTPDEQAQVQDLLRENPDVAREFAEMQKTRDHLRRAVGAQQMPGDLADRIRKQRRSSNVVEMPASRRGTSFRVYYAVAAAVLLLVAGWFVVDRYAGDDSSQLADVLGPAEEMLRIGMNDHLQCAVTFYKGDVEGYSREKMEKSLGPEFSALIPVAQQNISEGQLLVAHKCYFGGRRYVHLVLKDEDSMISLAITQKKEGESLTRRDGPFVTVSDVPVYHAAMDGFQIAGFESGEFLVFVASNMPEESNLRVTTNILVPVSDVLKSVQT